MTIDEIYSRVTREIDRGTNRKLLESSISYEKGLVTRPSSPLALHIYSSVIDGVRIQNIFNQYFKIGGKMGYKVGGQYNPTPYIEPYHSSSEKSSLTTRYSGSNVLELAEILEAEPDVKNMLATSTPEKWETVLKWALEDLQLIQNNSQSSDPRYKMLARELSYLSNKVGYYLSKQNMLKAKEVFLQGYMHLLPAAREIMTLQDLRKMLFVYIIFDVLTQIKNLNLLGYSHRFSAVDFSAELIPRFYIDQLTDVSKEVDIMSIINSGEQENLLLSDFEVDSFDYRMHMLLVRIINPELLSFSPDLREPHTYLLNEESDLEIVKRLIKKGELEHLPEMVFCLSEYLWDTEFLNLILSCDNATKLSLIEVYSLTGKTFKMEPQLRDLLIEIIISTLSTVNDFTIRTVLSKLKPELSMHPRIQECLDIISRSYYFEEPTRVVARGMVARER